MEIRDLSMDNFPVTMKNVKKPYITNSFVFSKSKILVYLECRQFFIWRFRGLKIKT